MSLIDENNKIDFAAVERERENPTPSTVFNKVISIEEYAKNRTMYANCIIYTANSTFVDVAPDKRGNVFVDKL